jgi:RNA polymerase-binding transcription factor DksA
VLDKKFIELMMGRLAARKEAKKAILSSGGEQALLHSTKDITRIEAAFQRIHDGTYGICTSCGIEISPDRLEIIPETPFCSECAAKISRDRARRQ